MSGAPQHIPAPPPIRPDLTLIGLIEKPAPRWRFTRRARQLGVLAALAAAFVVGHSLPFVVLPR